MKILTNLDPREYEHPLDQKALNSLENTRGLEKLIRKFYELGIEKILKIQYTGSNIKVTANNFPELYHTLEQCCEVLNLEYLPDLYIQPGDQLEGTTLGVEKPIIILDQAVFEQLDSKEWSFVLGKEVGHIKSAHMLYHEIGWLLPLISDALAAPTLGVSMLITAPLQLALVNWMRMSSYTSDRAGLLACQDVRVATQVLMKIAGWPKGADAPSCLDEFIIQAREFQGYDSKMFSRAIKFAGAFFSERSWTIDRANKFIAWAESDEYQKVLDRKTRIQQSEPPNYKFCPDCGSPLNGAEKFCPNCGKEIPLVSTTS